MIALYPVGGGVVVLAALWLLGLVGELLDHPFAALAVVVLWFVMDLLNEIRRRLAIRAADWALPESQAWTFRVALGIIEIAAAIAPEFRMSYRGPHLRDLPPTSWVWELWQIDLSRTQTDWWTADAALGEMKEDLEAEERVIDPVRFVLPLLVEAAGLRMFNADQRAKAWIFGGLRRIVILTAALPGLWGVFWLCFGEVVEKVHNRWTSWDV